MGFPPSTTDLFLVFILGLIMRRLDPLQGKAVIRYQCPRTLLYMPVVAFATGTAGGFLAIWQGLLLEPDQLRIYRELQRAQPDIARITRIKRTTLVLAGVKGAFQVVIIKIMLMAYLRVG